jgi:predicted dienelactone hydrolase
MKAAAVVALAAVVAVIIGVVGVLVVRAKDVTLPAPAGQYPVGRTITTWADSSRRGALGDAPGEPRTLSVWIWYPARPGGSPVPYMPPEWARERQADRGLGSLLFQNPKSIQGHATDAPPSPQGAPYPVIVLEPGLGPTIADYTSLAEDLASRGYVVIGLNPTHSAAISVVGGKVIAQNALGTIAENASPEEARRQGDALNKVWAADDRFAIDQAAKLNADSASGFAGMLDLQHIGLLGHSFGGAAALEASRLDTRVAAAADIDGWPYGVVAQSGLDRPVLLVSSEAESDATAPGAQAANAALAAIVAGAPDGFSVSIDGARHFNFTDSAVTFSPVERLTGVLGTINGARGLQITSAYLAAFFDQTLKGRASPLLEGGSEAYPEVRATSHRR